MNEFKDLQNRVHNLEVLYRSIVKELKDKGEIDELMIE